MQDLFLFVTQLRRCIVCQVIAERCLRQYRPIFHLGLVYTMRVAKNNRTNKYRPTLKICSVITNFIANLLLNVVVKEFKSRSVISEDMHDKSLKVRGCYFDSHCTVGIIIGLYTLQSSKFH